MRAPNCARPPRAATMVRRPCHASTLRGSTGKAGTDEVLRRCAVAGALDGRWAMDDGGQPHWWWVSMAAMGGPSDRPEAGRLEPVRRTIPEAPSVPRAAAGDCDGHDGTVAMAATMGAHFGPAGWRAFGTIAWHSRQILTTRMRGALSRGGRRRAGVQALCGGGPPGPDHLRSGCREAGHHPGRG